MENSISKAVIRRMPRYYRYLGELLEEGIERISSGELSQRMHVTASQIRQDLNNFGGFGQQGYGYNVQYLHDEIGKILGLNEMHNVIIIGAGNLGQAIANYARFERVSFKVIALFDVNPAMKDKTIRDIPVYMLSDLPEFVKNNKVNIAALTLPKKEAEPVAQQVVDLGIKAIWNFAHVDLDTFGEEITVENVHLSDSLMQLSYKIAERKRG